MQLSNARKMLENGASSEEVRKATGWFRGYDGKWRFEISDADSHLIENPALKKHTDDGEVYFTGKLSDIFDHKELYAAYPELKDINVVIQKTELGVDGIYQPKSNYITLSIEQFKRHTKAYHDYLDGGHRAEIKSIEATDAYKEYNRLYDDAVMDEMDPTEWLEAEKAAREKFYSSELGKRYYQLMWGKDRFSGDKFEFGWAKPAKETLLHELQHAVQDIEGLASGTNTRDPDYDRNAGEIEARDTARRANMTAEERKNTPPDIDREDVVVKSGKADAYLIVELQNGMQYVQASEGQVISGTDPEDWSKQVANYINKTIRNGTDFVIKTEQGDLLTITKDTAYKSATRNQVKNPDGTYRTMTDAEYRTKINASVHINELAQVSKKWNKPNVPDTKKHKFAKDGFSYRTAYFKDFDGKYYRLTISVGENGSVSTVYNVGQLKKDALPNGKIKTVYSGSKANSASHSFIISDSAEKSNSSAKKNAEISAEGGKSIRKSKDITPKVAEESGTQKPLLGVFDKRGRNIEAVRGMSETRFRAEILKRFKYSNADNVRTRDLIDYHLGKGAIAMLDAKPIEITAPEAVGDRTLKEAVGDLKIAGVYENADIGAVSIAPSRMKGYATAKLSKGDAALLSSLGDILERGRVVAFSHPDGVLYEELQIVAPIKIGEKTVYAEATVRRNDAGGGAYVYSVSTSADVKKTLYEIRKPAQSKRLTDKLDSEAVEKTARLKRRLKPIKLKLLLRYNLDKPRKIC